VLILAPAVPSWFSSQVALVSKVNKGAELGIHPQNHAAAVSAIATIGPAAGPILLAQEANASSAAVPSLDKDLDFVNEVHIRKKSPLRGLREGRYFGLVYDLGFSISHMVAFHWSRAPIGQGKPYLYKNYGVEAGSAAACGE